MNTRRVLLGSIALLSAPMVFADNTVQDFDNPGTFGTPVQYGSTPAPLITSDGGANGNFLRLINDLANGQSNAYVFDATSDGNWSSITASYDFRMIDSNGPADGIGFLLIPVARAGVTGAGLNDFAAEEPNTAGTLGIGLDVYPHPGSNDVSLHWNGAEQYNANTSTTGLLDFVNSGWNRVTVTYNQVGNGMNATVQLTKDVFGTPQTFMRIDQSVDARPYANRVQFSGRTGGLDVTADLDNINVAYSGTAATLPTINPGTRLQQDFDSLGASAYASNLFTPNATGLQVGPKIVASGGSGGGAFMRLMPDSQNGNIAALSFARVADGGLAPARKVEMDFRMANPDGVTPADGMGIVLLPTSVYGVSGAGANVTYENANIAGALSIGLRIYDGGPVNRVQLHWNGSEIVRNDLPGFPLLNNEWDRFSVSMVQVAGGSNVSVSLIQDVNGAATSYPIFTDQFVAGLVPYDYRVQVGSRTGGLNFQADVDNIRTLAIGNGYVNVNRTTTQDFDNPGTFYQAQDNHGFGVGDGTQHAQILTGGPAGNYLRLVHAVNDQNVNMGFDQVIPDGALKPRLTAGLDFRMSGQTTADRADGFSLGLYGTATYGTTGRIMDTNQSWENPAFADCLGVGIGIYDGNGASSTDYIRLCYNGATLYFDNTTNIPGLWDLNNDTFHHLQLTLTNAGPDSLATLTLTQDVFNGGGTSSLTLFSDIVVPGLDLNAWNFRVGLGGRTGGANADMDFDNLVVTPEPSALLLAAGGLAFLAGQRRRAGRVRI